MYEPPETPPLGESLLARLHLGVDYDSQHVRVGPDRQGMAGGRGRHPREDGMLEDDDGTLIENLPDPNDPTGSKVLTTRAFDRFYEQEIDMRDQLLDQNPDYHFLVLLAGVIGVPAYELIEEGYLGRLSLIENEVREYLRQQRNRVLQESTKRTQTLADLDTHIKETRASIDMLERVSRWIGGIVDRWQPFTDYIGFSPRTQTAMPYFIVGDAVELYQGASRSPTTPPATYVPRLLDTIAKEERLGFVDMDTTTANPFPALRAAFVQLLTEKGALLGKETLQLLTSIYAMIRDSACAPWNYFTGEPVARRRAFNSLYDRLQETKTKLQTAVPPLQANKIFIKSGLESSIVPMDDALSNDLFESVFYTHDTFKLQSLVDFNDWMVGLGGNDGPIKALATNMATTTSFTVRDKTGTKNTWTLQVPPKPAMNIRMWQHVVMNMAMTLDPTETKKTINPRLTPMNITFNNASIQYSPDDRSAILTLKFKVYDAKGTKTRDTASLVIESSGSLAHARPMLDAMIGAGTDQLKQLYSFLMGCFWIMVCFQEPVAFWQNVTSALTVMANDIRSGLVTKLLTQPVAKSLYTETYLQMLDMYFIAPSTVQTFLRQVYDVIYPEFVQNKAPLLTAATLPPDTAVFRASLRTAIDKVAVRLPDGISMLVQYAYGAPNLWTIATTGWSKITSNMRDAMPQWVTDWSQWGWNTTASIILDDFGVALRAVQDRVGTFWLSFVYGTQNVQFVLPWHTLVAFVDYYEPSHTARLTADLDATLTARAAGQTELNIMATGDYNAITQNIMDVIHKMYAPSRAWEMQVLITGRMRMKPFVVTGLARAHADLQKYIPQWSGVPSDLLTGNVTTSPKTQGSVIPPELATDYVVLVGAYINKARLSFPVQYNKDKQYALAPVEFMGAAAALHDYDVKYRGGTSWTVTRRPRVAPKRDRSFSASSSSSKRPRPWTHF